MVLEIRNINSMTDNASQSPRSARSPELQRGKLRSSFRMIRKLFKAKKQENSSTSNLSGSDIGDDQSIADHSSTGSPPPPYRRDSLDKSVSSLGSAASGVENQDRRELPRVDCHEGRGYPSRVVHITINRDSNTLLGIVISVSSEKQSTYPVVRRVLPDSQASKSGAVYAGDEVLAVGGVDVIGMTHRQVTSLFKSSGRQLTLTVRRRIGDLYLSSPGSDKVSPGRLSGNSSANGSPVVDGRIFQFENQCQVIEICRDAELDQVKETNVKMSTFHPTSPTGKLTSAPKSPTKGILLPGLGDSPERKNENEAFARFNRRAYSASAAVRSMKSPRHTLLVPGSAEMDLITMQDVVSPQSAPASPAESRRRDLENYDDDQDHDERSHSDYHDGADGADATEAWSAAPFVRSHSMRQPRRSGAGMWRERSSSQSNGRKGSHRRLRDSFRLGKRSPKQGDNANGDTSPGVNSSRSDSYPSSKLMTVSLKVPSLQELGLRLTGGSVSPYGACNLTAQSVSVYGTAKEVLKPGDSIVTIDGINTEQMTAFEAYRLLQNYLGKSVEVEISRTVRK